MILAINTNQPVLPPQVFRRPVLGGIIDTKHLPPPAGGSKTPSIPSIKGPLLTPPFEKLRKKANKVLPSFGSFNRRQGIFYKEKCDVFRTNCCLDQCGVTPQFGETRIMGGNEARFGQFPWVAYISIKGPHIDKMCAGSLINSRFYQFCHYKIIEKCPKVCFDSWPLCRFL